MNVRLLGIATVAAIMAGCAPLLTGTNNTEDALRVMQQQNARGCVYVKAKAQPWADATLMVVGTWGQDPPDYAECWKGLPREVP